MHLPTSPWTLDLGPPNSSLSHWTVRLPETLCYLLSLSTFDLSWERPADRIRHEESLLPHHAKLEDKLGRQVSPGQIMAPSISTITRYIRFGHPCNLDSQL